jgi:hypothetical protein
MRSVRQLASVPVLTSPQYRAAISSGRKYSVDRATSCSEWKVHASSVPTMADLISGQVAMAVVGLTGQSLEFHRTGKLRILAVTSPTRLTAAPELSTV